MNTEQNILIIIACVVLVLWASFYAIPVHVNPATNIEYIKLVAMSFIALSVLFVIWYFIIWPIRLSRKLSLSLNEEEV